MSGESYRALGEQYKTNKKGALFDGWEETPRTKKRGKNKGKQRGKCKHENVPAIFYCYFTNFDKTKSSTVTLGSYCKKCGRVEDMRFIWGNKESEIQKFKSKFPDYRIISLPEEWDMFKDKCIPIN